ncbi:f-box domain-containing protein [Gigaspora margarita]|uniref:F-box domain-containing protein n=1 Tax=Gigaspora margarita TaxID=4874 RepID=A0A8H4AFA9_GIGMA|nr:f-box domain-containing protein [Gigaspora margarita]
MITLPNECYYEIFNNLRQDYKNLFSCALVNRQWCRIVIPILWCEPGHHFKDIRLIRIFLLTLNAEEQAQMIPFKIALPSHPKPIFEYTSHITSISKDLHHGIDNWLYYKSEVYKLGRELENTLKYSLIAMFLRTSKSLKHLYLDEIICNQSLFENLHEKTAITSLDLFLSYNFSDEFIFKAIDVVKALLIVLVLKMEKF